MLYKAALVLEGGALRGQYTAGVVDSFLEQGIEFDCVIGVSAGALCGANFVSKQFGRVTNVNTGYRHRRDYISMGRMLKRESIINLDFLFADHGWDWHQFDERAYQRSASDFIIVATSLATGKAVTFEKPTGDELINALKASSSIPFIGDPQQTTQGECLDGGVADSIPYDVALKQGFDKMVIVRTRDQQFRKKPSSRFEKLMYHRVYKDYPAFIETGINRPVVYNHQVATVDKLVKEGKAYCICPQKPVKVSRLEYNTKKLTKLYLEGRRESKAQTTAIRKFLADTAY